MKILRMGLAVTCLLWLAGCRRSDGSRVAEMSRTPTPAFGTPPGPLGTGSGIPGVIIIAGVGTGGDGGVQ